jgi:hypothetical protein
MKEYIGLAIVSIGLAFIVAGIFSSLIRTEGKPFGERLLYLLYDFSSGEDFADENNSQFLIGLGIFLGILGLFISSGLII